MTNDVILNKVENIEHCIARVRETYKKNSAKLLDDFDVQDIIVLNLQRACEAAIDVAMHLIKIKKIGIPKDSRDAFHQLASQKIITKSLCEQLSKMVGFRNIIIHEYTKIDYEIVQAVILKEIEALSSYVSILLKLT